MSGLEHAANPAQVIETSAEANRLKEVYRGYASRGLGGSRWSNSNRGNKAIQAERELKTILLLNRSGFFPLANRRILDLGCGAGELLGLFLEWGAKAQNLFGIDLMPDRIHMARENFPACSFQAGNAELLPYPDAEFDLVTVFTVFTSILDRRMAANVSREIARVLSPGGAVLWYDLRRNNPFNKNVRGLSRKRIQELFPSFRMNLESISLLPPLARRLGPLTNVFYDPLAVLPLMRTHLIGLLTRAFSDGSGSWR